MFHARWMYHVVGAPRLVQTQEDLDALTPEWADSPQAAALAAARQMELTDEQKHAALEAEVARVAQEKMDAATTARLAAEAEVDAEIRKLLDEDAAKKSAEADAAVNLQLLANGAK